MAFRRVDRLLSEHHAEQAYERDKRRGRGPHLNEAVSHASSETHDKRDEIADHDDPLFLRPAG